MSKKVFLLLKRLSYSCKGFYAGSWIMNKVMNCSCCLLFCQSAVWPESRLDPPPLLSIFASDPWKAARRQQSEPGIEHRGAEAGFLRSPLNGLDVHTPILWMWNTGLNTPVTPRVWTERRARNSSWGTALAEMMLSRNGGAGITCHSF